MMDVDGAGAANQRRERPLRSMLRHERQTVAMELAAALHHSRYARSNVSYAAPGGQMTASSGMRPSPLSEQSLSVAWLPGLLSWVCHRWLTRPLKPSMVPPQEARGVEEERGGGRGGRGSFPRSPLLDPLAWTLFSTCLPSLSVLFRVWVLPVVCVLLGLTAGTRSCVSLWSFWTIFLRAPRIWQSSVGVCVARGAQENLDGVGDDFMNMLSTTARCLVRCWIHARASVCGCIWMNFTQFLRERALGSWSTSLSSGSAKLQQS